MNRTRTILLAGAAAEMFFNHAKDKSPTRKRSRK
jgi:hypothetical protein